MNDLKANSNINNNFFVDIPVRSLIFILKKLRILALFKKHVRDSRAKKGTYSIESLLMVALEILLFRAPSKNNFYQNRKLGRVNAYRNLGQLAGIKEDCFPHSKTLDDAFWLLKPDDLEPCLFEIFEQLCSSKLFTNHPLLKKNGTYHLIIDAVTSHTYYPSSQHPCESCPYCLKRCRKTKEGEKIWFLHIDVIASLIFENGFQLPLQCHRIKKITEWDFLSEDDLKEECELTALPIILQKIRTYLPKIPLTLLLDGLYANQTVLTILKQFHCDYSIVLKRLTTVKDDFNSLPKDDFNSLPKDVHMRKIAPKRFFLTQTAQFANDMVYENHQFSVIDFTEYAQKKPNKRFAKVNYKQVHYQWMTSKKINASNIFKQAQASRNRWWEEDLFQTLKKRGFSFEHDYSRHPNSQWVWLFLTLIAFAITSILQLCDLGILARKKRTIIAFMEQMLQDLFYLSYEMIFLCIYPQQLRFSLWSGAS